MMTTITTCSAWLVHAGDKVAFQGTRYFVRSARVLPTGQVDWEVNLIDEDMARASVCMAESNQVEIIG